MRILTPGRKSITFEATLGTGEAVGNVRATLRKILTSTTTESVLAINLSHQGDGVYTGITQSLELTEGERYVVTYVAQTTIDGTLQRDQGLDVVSELIEISSLSTTTTVETTTPPVFIGETLTGKVIGG